VAGTLFVVATPLGNLSDLSPRAAETLKRVAVVAAEDTRRTKALLRHLGSTADLVSVHAHAAPQAVDRVVQLLALGKDVALVTDAGTPAVSDPGATVVGAARAHGALVTTVPGPTAVAAALAVSGLSADRFIFIGFLPRKGPERRRLLGAVAESEWTAVLFESPNRVAPLLADLADVCGPEREATVSREMTKVFEETRAGSLGTLAELFAATPARGEVTVVVSGTGRAPRAPAPPPDPEERIRAWLAEGLSRKDVAERLASESGISRNTAYRLVNELGA
jgi:16S rRNA (cytidine1402-2'-O)-methyltransferase